MRLIEILQKLSRDTLVGIWNIDSNSRRNDRCPTPQTYQKVCNIQLKKIINIIDYEVFSINVNEKNNGLLIRVYDKDRLNMSINNSDLANKIKEK